MYPVTVRGTKDVDTYPYTPPPMGTAYLPILRTHPTTWGLGLIKQLVMTFPPYWNSNILDNEIMLFAL
jgi:hypothetical protein